MVALILAFWLTHTVLALRYMAPGPEPNPVSDPRFHFDQIAREIALYSPIHIRDPLHQQFLDFLGAWLTYPPLVVVVAGMICVSLLLWLREYRTRNFT